MKVEEAIKLINEAKEIPYSIYEAEWFIEYKKILATNVNLETHRWYAISTTYYELEDGILGIKGVSHLFSEGMNPSDCNVRSYAFEGEAYTTINYRPLV